MKLSKHDSLSFQSLFFEPKSLVYKESQNLVVYLKEKTNILEEVSIVGAVPFDEEKFNVNLRASLIDDSKKRPYLYGQNVSLNANLIGLAFLIVDLISKEKTAESTYVPTYVRIDYKYLTDLFDSNHSTYNDRFITETLKISLEQKSLFFDFCEVQKFKILEKDFNDFIILDFLVKQSKKFKQRQKSGRD